MKRLCPKCQKIRSSAHFRKSACHLRKPGSWAYSLAMRPLHRPWFKRKTLNRIKKEHRKSYIEFKLEESRKQAFADLNRPPKKKVAK